MKTFFVSTYYLVRFLGRVIHKFYFGKPKGKRFFQDMAYIEAYFITKTYIQEMEASVAKVKDHLTDLGFSTESADPTKPHFGQKTKDTLN